MVSGDLLLNISGLTTNLLRKMNRSEAEKILTESNINWVVSYSARGFAEETDYNLIDPEKEDVWDKHYRSIGDSQSKYRCHPISEMREKAIEIILQQYNDKDPKFTMTHYPPPEWAWLCPKYQRWSD